MGMALLLLAANYSVHLFCGIRFRDHSAAILMNLSTSSCPTGSSVRL